MATMRANGVNNPKFMIIVPKSAISTWRRECYEQTPDLMQSMVIYSYSQLHNAIKALKYMDIRMLGFDESHYLKSPETNRIEELAKFMDAIHLTSGGFKGGRMMLLSGTPMPNSAVELYTSWAMCCAPNLQEAAARVRDVKRYEDWKKTFAKKKEQSWDSGRGKIKKKNFGTKWSGVDNEDMLSQLLAPFTHYRRVSDCLDLPTKQEIPVDLGLEDDKLLADANIEAPEAYMALVERLAAAKTPHMLNWVGEYIQAGHGEQLVVFAMHRHPIEELKLKFPNQVRTITGMASDVERSQNLKDFQDKKFQILALTYACGSEALNLQNCHKSLYCGYPWTDGRLRQAIARTWRQGQTERTMHYFLTSGSNDMKILSNVRAKEEATTKVENLLLIQNPHVRESLRQPIMLLDQLI